MISRFLFMFFVLLASFSNITASDIRSHPYFDMDNLADYYGHKIENRDKDRWRRPVVDPRREDDHDDFELAGIMALAHGSIDHDEDKIDDEERQRMADLHNMYRSNTTGIFPPGSDIEFISYNYTLILENNSYEYLRVCKMAHGWAANDQLAGLQGQNLYNGPSREFHRGMWLFYIEYVWYYFNNRTCWPPHTKYVCGHLIQMMWHNSSMIGGSRRTHCFPKQKRLMIHNIHYVGRGVKEDHGYRLYQYGYHCTRCPPGMWCSNNLCLWPYQCAMYNMDCKCLRPCKNCVKPNWEECRCGTCKLGWDWADCSYPCQNANDAFLKKVYCRKYYRTRCIEERWWRQGCQHFCRDCNKMGDKGVDNTLLCCGGKVCEDFHILNEETCECELDCPSDLCMFDWTTAPPTTEAPTTEAPTTETTTSAGEPQTNLTAAKPKPPPFSSRSSNLLPDSFRCLFLATIQIFVSLILLK